MKIEMQTKMGSIIITRRNKILSIPPSLFQRTILIIRKSADVCFNLYTLYTNRREDEVRSLTLAPIPPAHRSIDPIRPPARL